MYQLDDSGSEPSNYYGYFHVYCWILLTVIIRNPAQCSKITAL